MIKSKNEIQIEQQFLYILAQVFEAFPQYSIAQHITHFMRRKGDKKDVYDWSPETVLNKIEQYYDELKNDLLSNPENYED